MGKLPYFENAWVTSAAASIGGSIYTTIILTVVTGGEMSPIGSSVVFFALALLSFAILACGYIMFGWWIIRFICKRVRVNRVFLLAMAGMLLGFIVYLGVLAVLVYGFPFLIPFVSPLLRPPRNLSGLMDYGVVASIPMFYLMLAGIVSALHQNKIEQRR